MFLITSNQSSEVKLTRLVDLCIVDFSVGNKGRFPVILYIAIPGKYRYVGSQVFTKKNSKFLTQQNLKIRCESWVFFDFPQNNRFKFQLFRKFSRTYIHENNHFLGAPQQKKPHWITKNHHPSSCCVITSTFKSFLGWILESLWFPRCNWRHGVAS